MRVVSTLRPDQFEALLRHLDPDRDQAGVRYEELRRRLITIFTYRGCPNPEDLADETLDRVGRKLLELAGNFRGDNPSRFVFGVAWNIVKESFHQQRTVPLPDDAHLPVASEPDKSDEMRTRRQSCLERCLGLLAEPDRDLVLNYFREEKRAKVRQRSVLAGQLHISPNALRIRISRITLRLRECVVQRLTAGRPRAVRLE